MDVKQLERKGERQVAWLLVAWLLDFSGVTFSCFLDVLVTELFLWMHLIVDPQVNIHNMSSPLILFPNYNHYLSKPSLQAHFKIVDFY